jgi:hypothetical protein
MFHESQLFYAATLGNDVQISNAMGEPTFINQ